MQRQLQQSLLLKLHLEENMSAIHFHFKLDSPEQIPEKLKYWRIYIPVYGT